LRDKCLHISIYQKQFFLQAKAKISQLLARQIAKRSPAFKQGVAKQFFGSRESLRFLRNFPSPYAMENSLRDSFNTINLSKSSRFASNFSPISPPKHEVFIPFSF
jgi:hypothetical protein